MTIIEHPDFEVKPVVIQLAIGMLSEILTQEEIDLLPIEPFKEVKDVEKRRDVLINDLQAVHPFACAMRLASDHIKKFITTTDAPSTLSMVRCMRIVEAAKGLNELAWDMWRVSLKSNTPHIGLQNHEGHLALYEFADNKTEEEESPEDARKRAFVEAIKGIFS